MAALSITAANVLAGGAAKTTTGIAGAAVTRGQVLYQDTADGKWKLADDDSGTLAARIPGGIALDDSGPGQPISVLTHGPITVGATLTAGIAYYLGPTPGGIVPVADVTTGQSPAIVGIATSTTVLNVDFQPSGATL